MINTVYELITDVMAKQYPDRVAFRYVAADGKTVVEKTYAQYVQDIRRAVTYFKENIPDIKGKRVGIMSRNCYEYGVNSFGAILAGAVVVTINQKKTWPELEYELGLVEPSLIVNDGIDYGCRPDIEAAYGDKLRPMDAFKDSAPAELVDCVGHDDLMVLMFTSGTTGRSKAVMLSERNFFTTVECQVKFGGAMLAELAQQGMMITQVYGMTETCGDGIINYEQDEKHIRAVGKPDDHAEYKLDETGEICIRGGCVMLGYYKDPEATAEVLDADGWFHTGDLARVDEDGFYYITGRKKNIIILDNGENVSPEELENLLSKCEAVKECIVREKGKKICAVIYCGEADQQTVRDFITETNRTLPLYKRMSAVEFSTEPLPRTGTGKLLRK